MTERVIEAEVVEEHTIACPRCRRSNRVYKRNTLGVYKCGACRTALPNPFAALKGGPSMRMFGIAAAAIIALLAIIVVIGSTKSAPRSLAQQAEIRNAAERDARVDRIISENGPSALPRMPKPDYYPSKLNSIPAPFSSISNAPVPTLSRSEPAAAPPADIPTVTPRNNEILFDAYPNSNFRGELTVDNGTPSHAVAKLIDRRTHQKILSFTISARNKAIIHAIPDGSYDLLFAFGDQLYVRTDRFKTAHGFSKFADTMDFTTRATDESIVWSKNSVTLHTVISGNARTQSLSRGEFERY